MPTPTMKFAVPAVLAALSLTATPVAAAELPTASRYEPARATSDYGWGWGGHRHRYRHRDRTSAGDVLGAVLVLGTIAAVANAASKANRARGYPYPAPYPYPDRRGDYRPDRPQGLERAADMCLAEVERDARARDVTRVERNASGWLVTGELADGAAFTCSIGADGRIERVEVGGRAQDLSGYEERSEPENLRDYPAPEARSGSENLRDYPSAEPQAEDADGPAYPGGPLPGDEDAVADDGDA